MSIIKPLKRAYAKPASEQLIADIMKAGNMTREEALANLDHEDRGEIWRNDVYQVTKHDCGNMWWLNIRRISGKPIFRDWRHFQAIKNQLCGPECEAVELYPAESRVVDTSNKYHLWVIKDPSVRFPFGFGPAHPDAGVRMEGGQSRGTMNRRLDQGVMTEPEDAA